MLNLFTTVLMSFLILLLLSSQLTHASTAAATADDDDGGDAAGCRQYVERSEIEQRLSTKTPYRAIANYNDTPPIYNGMPFADSYS